MLRDLVRLGGLLKRLSRAAGVELQSGFARRARGGLGFCPHEQQFQILRHMQK
jgi:hypothetical protein